MTQKHKNNIQKEIDVLAKQGLRTLAFSYKEDLGDLNDYSGQENHKCHKLLMKAENFASFEKNQIFLGVVAMQDPPRY